MSRKISDFFNKQSIKIESIQESSNSSESSTENAQNSATNESQEKVDKNVKNETEKQLLVILPQQRIHVLPVPIKIEDSDSKNVKFTCKICDKNYSSKKVLRWHIRKIHKLPVPIKIEEKKSNNDSIQCKICDKKFTKICNFNTHQSIHDKKFRCIICDKKFPKNHNLLKHIRNVHENPGSFKCDVCKIGFNSKCGLTSHQKIHIKNRPKPFKCDTCDFTADNKSKLKRHEEIHEKIINRCEKCKKKLFKNRTHECRLDCKYCGKKFSHSGTVLDHIKRCHAQQSERSFYECDICGFRVIRKKILVFHMDEKHVNEKNLIFTCDLDGKAFKMKAKLDQHMKTHLPPVKCDFCFKKVNIRHLRGHIKSFHTGIKPPMKQNIKKQLQKSKIFECPICFNMFLTKQILNRHIKSHNKSIKCKFCEKLFGCQSSLKTHIRRYHENSAEIICNICGKKILRQDYLKIHLKTHDPNRARNLKCTQCDYVTDNKKSLEAHLNFHKKIDAKIAAMTNPHKCPQCPAVKGSKKSLSKHVLRVHPKVSFECDICGRMIKVKGGLLLHFRKFHKIGI